MGNSVNTAITPAGSSGFSYNKYWRMVRLCYTGESCILKAEERPRLLFVTSGKAFLPPEYCADALIMEGEMTVIPAGQPCEVRAARITRMIICTLPTSVNCCPKACDSAHILSLLCGSDVKIFSYGALIREELALVQYYMDSRIYGPKLYDIKCWQLFLLLYHRFGQAAGKTLPPCLKTAIRRETVTAMNEATAGMER